MTILNTNSKQLLEKLLQMSGGGVLNFTNRTFSEFFRDDLGVEIYDQKYHYASGSKANLMRGFWQVADKSLVDKSIIKLIDYVENQILLGCLRKEDFSSDLIKRAKEIAGEIIINQNPTSDIDEDEFINREFKNVSIDKLNLSSQITNILQQRIEEIRKCLKARASLSVIFLCGSTLEGILLGVASLKPKVFNQSDISPKDKNGKVLAFYDWKLSDFINVARDVNLIGEDVKKFAHALRDFRNYIHPFQQMSENFDPNEHTAKISWQVLQAAISQLKQ